MGLAKWATSLGKKALSFQILFACRAIKTLRVVIIIHSLHPFISRLNSKFTSMALYSEHFIPILVTVWSSIFQVERIISKSGRGRLLLKGHTKWRCDVQL